MRIRSLFALFLALVLLAGCSSSRDMTSANDASSPASSPPDQTTSDPAPADVAAPTAPQDWFHRDPQSTAYYGIGTDTTYQTFLNDQQPKRSVIVAVIDGGVDIDHEDLKANVWTNQDEVPGNGTDDDQNGYVDDVHGWNFIGGPNGENVNHDTYELTRIYDELAEHFADVDTAGLSPETNEKYARYLKFKHKFKHKRQEKAQQYANVKQAADVVDQAVATLKEHLQVDELTREQVAAVDPTASHLRRSKEVLMYFYEQGLVPEDITEYKTQLENQLEYGYNPDFEPRSIVGDNYANVNERIYGNNDVAGPDAGHGTHVAGIIAAQRNNGLGVDGVAHSVRIMSVRTVPNGDERDKDVANAIRYAVDNGADIINMSFGKSYSPRKEAVDAAVRYADERGVLMVHAAGNDGTNNDSTASYPNDTYLDGGTATNWIEVGASSWKGGSELAAPFSNYGAQTVDVFAPGVAIHSTAPNHQYESNDGTSMAAPVVSGLAALLMAYHPDLTATQVRDIILSSVAAYPNQQVTVPGSTNRSVEFSNLSATGGIVNAYRAFQHLAQNAEK